MEKIETICGICPGQCHVWVEIEDGRIKKVGPSTKNKPAALCTRGTAPDAVINSKDRVKYPMRRVGKKGTLEFERISWKEAKEEIRKNFTKIIDQHGPQALASHYGRGAFDNQSSLLLHKRGKDDELVGLFGRIGSPNNGAVGSLCYVAFGQFAPATVYGFNQSWIQTDLENAKTIVVWGSNPKNGSPPFTYQLLRDAQKRGAKIINIDHFESDSAKMADQYIEVKSGTDGALILGMLNYMFENQLIEQDFLCKYTYGWESIKDYVKEFDLEKVEKLTGVPKETIVQFTKEICGDEGISLIAYTGLEYSDQGVQTIRAQDILWALSGNLDVKGGLLINPQYSKSSVKDRQSKNFGIQAIGEKEFPFFVDSLGNCQFTKFPQAVLENDPYPLRGLFNIGSVISQVYPSSQLFEQALIELDYFVTADRFMTKDAYYADLILPATTYYEDDTFAVYPGKIELSPRVVEPVGESKSNYEILHTVADALGYGEYYPKDSNELIDICFYNKPEIIEALNREGIYYYPENKEERQYKKWETGGLRKDGKPGFPTPTGKLEIHSTVLESYGFSPIPIYEGGKESEKGSPELFQKYPLVLNTGARIKSTFRTQHLNIPELVKFQPNAEFLIHPEDAGARGIENGDLCYVYNDRGKIPMTAHVTERAQKGDLEANMGGGSPFQVDGWKDANTNYLTDINHQDPISGFPVFKRELCEVEKV